MARRSTPPASTRVMASAIASTAAIIMKLPPSFTKLAADGDVPTRNVRWPIASKSGLHRSMASLSPAATTKSFAACAAEGRPKTGADTNPECAAWSCVRRSTSGTPIVLCETCSAGAQGCRLAVDDGFHGHVIRKHSHHDIALSRFGGTAGQPCACRNQILRFVSRTVPNRQVVPGLEQVRGDCTAHLPNPMKPTLMSVSVRLARRSLAVTIEPNKSPTLQDGGIESHEAHRRCLAV